MLQLQPHPPCPAQPRVQGTPAKQLNVFGRPTVQEWGKRGVKCCGQHHGDDPPPGKKRQVVPALRQIDAVRPVGAIPPGWRDAPGPARQRSNWLLPAPEAPSNRGRRPVAAKGDRKGKATKGRSSRNLQLEGAWAGGGPFRPTRVGPGEIPRPPQAASPK